MRWVGDHHSRGAGDLPCLTRQPFTISRDDRQTSNSKFVESGSITETGTYHFVDEFTVGGNVYVVRSARKHLFPQESGRTKHEPDIDIGLLLRKGRNFGKGIAGIARSRDDGVVPGLAPASDEHCNSEGDGYDSNGADDGIRTRDPHLGKVMLYQLSHVRVRDLSLATGRQTPPCRFPWCEPNWW